jgi:putative glutamine amidotransferase
MGVTAEENRAYFTPDENRKTYEAYYLKALAAVGAESTLVNPEWSDAEIRSAIEASDGLLLVGGRDVYPERFGQTLHPKARLVPLRREEADFLAFDLARKFDMPVLGICRGCQVMGVARGGTMYQHLPDIVTEIDHGSDKEKVRHIVTREDDGGPVDWPAEFETNSYHHQAIDNPGELKILGRSKDGIIEVCYDPSMRWALAVQWHPELIADEPFHRKIFEDFTRACAEYGRR